MWRGPVLSEVEEPRPRTAGGSEEVFDVEKRRYYCVVTCSEIPNGQVTACPPMVFSRLRFRWRKQKSDLASGRFLRNHKLLDGFDEVLNGGIMSFQAAVQLVYLGCELAVLG